MTPPLRWCVNDRDVCWEDIQGKNTVLGRSNMIELSLRIHSPCMCSTFSGEIESELFFSHDFLPITTCGRGQSSIGR